MIFQSVKLECESGAIWICVDLKLLGESVLMEVHPLPKLDKTLTHLMGARIFSMLDTII